MSHARAAGSVSRAGVLEKGRKVKAGIRRDSRVSKSTKRLRALGMAAAALLARDTFAQTVNWVSGTNTVANSTTLTVATLNVSGGTNTIQTDAFLNIVSGGSGINFAGAGGPSINIASDSFLPGMITLTTSTTFTGNSALGAGIFSTGTGGDRGTIDLGGAQPVFQIAPTSSSVDFDVTAQIIDGSVIKTGAGSLRFAGGNTYAGLTSINAGTLIVTGDQALGTATNSDHTTASSTVIASGGTLAFSGGFSYATAEALYVNGAGVNSEGAIYNLNGANTFVGTLNLQGNTSIGAAVGSSLLLTGQIKGSFVFSKVGAGAVQLNLPAGLTSTPTEIAVLGGTLTIGTGTIATQEIFADGGNLVITGGTTTLSGNAIFGQNLNGNVVTQSGGSLSLGTGQEIVLGNGASSDGTYNLSGTGIVSLSSSGATDVGASGAGIFNQSGGTLTTGVLNLAAAGGRGNYNLTTGILNVSGNESIASAGTAIGVFNQTGGTHAIGGALTLANGTGTSGTYTLSGGTLNVTGSASVGVGGTASFVQSGGSFTVATDFSVGGQANTGIGTYSLIAGTLSVGTETVGATDMYSGAGTFIQSGGTHNVSNQLYVGSTLGSGTFLLSAGTLNVTNNVGVQSGGEFDQGGGTFHVITGGGPGFLAVAGTYNLSGTNSTVLNIDNTLFLDGGGTGAVFHQMGAINNVGASLIVGNNSGNLGTYDLFDGSMNITGEADIGGYSGTSTGVFNHFGGTLSAASINLAISTGSTGTYSLMSGSLSAPNLNVGGFVSTAGGAGVLNVSGGAATVSGATKVWNTAGSAINLSGGTLSTGTLDLSGNNSRLNWTGGVLAFTNTPTLTANTSSIFGTSFSLGSARGLSTTGTLVIPSGSTFAVGGGSLNVGALDTQTTPSRFNWTSGALTFTGSDVIIDSGTPLGSSLTIGTGMALNTIGFNEIVGSATAGTLTQTGGTNNVGTSLPGQTGSLYLGMNSGTGSYSLGPGAVLQVSASTVVGDFGNGTFTQTGGTAGATVDLILANNSHTTGSYSMSGGSMDAGTSELIGAMGTGTFTQTGGTNIAESYLALGDFVNAVGTYNLNGGTLIVGNSAFIGGNPGSPGSAGGTGVFNISAGSATIAGTLTIFNTAGTGVNLSGGTLAVGTLTASNPSRFNWTGGTLAFTQTTDVNQSLGSTFTLAANQNLIVQGSEYIASTTSETINQTGGTHTVTGNLEAAVDSSAGFATYNLSGGTLQVLGNEDIGVTGGVAQFTQTGGLHNNSGAASVLTINDAEYDLSGGQLNANTEYLSQNSETIFDQTGGTHSVATLNMGFFPDAFATYIMNGRKAVLIAGSITLEHGDFSLMRGYVSAGALSLGGQTTMSGGTLAAGTIHLGNIATFTGGVLLPTSFNVDGGTTQVLASNFFPAGTSVSVGSGATLDFSGNPQTITSLSGAGSITLGVNGSLSAGGNTPASTFSGVLSGTSASFSKVGLSTLVLSGSNTYTGSTTVVAGTLMLGASQTLPSSSPVVILPGALLDTQGFTQLSSGLSGGGTLSIPSGNFTNGGTSTFSGLIEGAGEITQLAGMLTLTGANTFSGPTFLDGGILSISSAANLGSSNFLFFESGTLQGAANFALSTPMSILTSGSAIDVPSGDTFTAAGAISGTNSLNKTGLGTLVLTGANSFTGLSVTAGTLSVPNDAALGANSTLHLANGVTLQFDGSFLSNRGITLNSGAIAALDVTANHTATLGGLISALISGGINKTGLGTLVLTDDALYTGPTSISAGTLVMASSFLMSSSSPVTVAGGAILELNGNAPIFASLAGSGTVKLDAPATLTVNPSADETFSGNITGGGAFVKSGNATLTLAGSSDFTGSTSIAAGTLALAVNNALPSTTSLGFNIGTSLVLEGVSQTLDSLAGAGAISSSVAPSTLTLNTQSAGANFSGSLNSNIAVNKLGPGSQTFSGTIASSSPLNVSGGSVVVSGTNNSTGGVNLYTGGTLSVATLGNLGAAGTTVNFFGGTLATTGTFTDTYPLVFSVPGGTINVATGTTLTLNSTVTGSSSAPFIKSGFGTLNIITAAAHTAPIDLQQGTLSLSANGSLASSQITLEALTTLLLDDTSVNIPRLQSTANLVLAGGTFQISGGGTISQSLAALSVTSGGSTIALVGSATGGTITLSFASTSAPGRAPGATLDVDGVGSLNSVKFAGGFSGQLPSYYTVDAQDFATYSASAGVVAVNNYHVNNFTVGGNVKIDPSVPSPAAPTSVGTVAIDNLNLATAGGAINIAQNGNTLTLNSGGLIKTGSNSAVLGSGGGAPVGPSQLTSGSGELDVFVGAGPAGAELSYVGKITGAIDLLKSGAGTFVLGGGPGDTTPNIYGGTTYVNGGNLILNKASGVFAVPGSLSINGGNVISLQPNQIATGAAVTLNSGQYLGSSQGQTLTSLTINGGVYTTGNNTNDAIVDPSNGGGLGELEGFNSTLTGTAGLMTINNGSAIVQSGTTFFCTSLAINGGTTTVQSSGILQVGVGSATFSSGASLTLNAGTTPGTLILGSTLTVNGAASTASIVSSSATNPGVIDLGGNSARSFFINAGTTSPDMLISAKIIDGGLFKDGAGTLRLTAANTYAGGTILSKGALEVANSAALGTGAVTFANSLAELRVVADTGILIPNPITNAGSGVMLDAIRGTSTSNTLATVTFGGAVTLGPSLMSTASSANMSLAFASPVTLNSSIAITNATPLLFGAAITGGANVAVTKTGTGTVTFAGSVSNSFGGTIVDQGTLVLAKTNNALAIPGSLQIVDGTVQLAQNEQIASSAIVTLSVANTSPSLQLNGNTQTLSGLIFSAGGTVGTSAAGGTLGTLNLVGNVTFSGVTGSATLDGQVALGSSVRTFSVSDGSATIDLAVPAKLTGANGLIKTGAGTMSLTNPANTFTGGVTVAAGTLEVAGDGSINNNTITLAGGSLISNGALSAPIVFNSVASSITVLGSDSTTFNSPLGGTAGLTKTGTGVLVLAGADTFSGSVAVSSGVLALDSDTRLGNSNNSVMLMGAALRATSTFASARTIAVSSTGNTIDVQPGATLTLMGNFQMGVSGAPASLIKTPGTGNLSFAGAQTWNAGSLYTNGAGNTMFASSPGANLSVNATAGGVTFAAGTTIGNLTASGATITAAAGLTAAAVSLASSAAVTTGGFASFNSLSINSASLSANGGAIGSFTSTASTLSSKSPLSITPAALSWNGATTFAGGSTVSINPLAGVIATAQQSTSIVVNGNTTLSTGGSADPFPEAGMLVSASVVTGSSLTISAGAARLSSITGQGAVNVQSGAALTVDNLTSGPLTIAGTVLLTQNGAHTAAPSSLSVTGQGHLNLYDNDMVIPYTSGNASPASSIRSLLASGFNQGNWNGPGIDSSAAAAQTTLTALGYADTGTSVIVKYTYYGDSNLDGTVDANDFKLFLAGLVSFNASSWSQGDYTYDGKVDLGNDFNLFLRSYLTQGGALGDLSAVASDDSDLTMAQRAYVQSLLPSDAPELTAAAPAPTAAAPTIVPEPTGASILLLSPILLARRRRRAL